jgi:hypothetical protein
MKLQHSFKTGLRAIALGGILTAAQLSTASAQDATYVSPYITGMTYLSYSDSIAPVTESSAFVGDASQVTDDNPGRGDDQRPARESDPRDLIFFPLQAAIIQPFPPVETAPVTRSVGTSNLQSSWSTGGVGVFR